MSALDYYKNERQNIIYGIQNKRRQVNQLAIELKGLKVILKEYDRLIQKYKEVQNEM